MSLGHHEPEQGNSSSGTNTILIVLGVVIVLMVGGALLIVVRLAAITTIGSRANVTFQTVGNSLSGGTAAIPTVKEEPADHPADVRRVLENQQEAWNKGDLEGFMEGYRHSPDLTFYSADRPRRGWEQVYARYKERYGGGKEMGTLSFSNLKIDLLGSDQALVRGERCRPCRYCGPSPPHLHAPPVPEASLDKVSGCVRPGKLVPSPNNLLFAGNPGAEPSEGSP